MGDPDRRRDVEPLHHPPAHLLCPLCEGIKNYFFSVSFLLIAVFLFTPKAKRRGIPFDVTTKLLKVAPIIFSFKVH